jgi:glycosyltransferase involved in cell wall biosynthesis
MFCMPVRLLFLNTRDGYGADVAVHVTLMSHFAPSEADVFVLSNSEAADADQMRVRLAGIQRISATFLPLGRPYEAVASSGKLSKALTYAPSAVSLVRAAAFIKRHRIQIIHATDRPRDASFASLLGRITSVATVVHMHATVGNHITRPTLWGMRNATGIFAVSDFTKNELCTLGLQPTKIHRIHNAVDAVHFDPDRSPAERSDIRNRFRIPQTAPVVGIAARMTAWKGQRELIGAAASLRGKYPDLHVLILGADVPDCRADYMKRAQEGGIADRVHFAGHQKDVRPFLQEIDVFVHPSYGEPFGLSIVEAMAMRKPVVACNSGGVPEIITDGKDGVLVEERSVEAVASAMSTLLDNAESRRRMGENARETVRTRFSPRRQCAKAAELYNNLIAAA